MKVIWHETALLALQNILAYITHRESLQVAKKVVRELKNKANGLSVFPEKYQRETLIQTNRNIRRIVVHSYKILYEIHPDHIRILDIFHTSQSPDKLDDL